MTPSFFVDKFEEIFGLLGYYIQCLGNYFACFFSVKFNNDVAVVLFRGLQIEKVSGATFGFVRIMLGAIFHLFVFSLQTPMYETDENKNNGNLHMQNVTGNENLAAPIHEEKPTSLYPHVHIVNNPIPISTNMTECQTNHPNVSLSSGNAPLISIVNTHGNDFSTSSTFWNNSIDGNAPNTSTEMLQTTMEMLHYPHLKFFVILRKEAQKIRKKMKKKSKNKNKNTYLHAL